VTNQVCSNLCSESCAASRNRFDSVCFTVRSAAVGQGPAATWIARRRNDITSSDGATADRHSMQMQTTAMHAGRFAWTRD
jgi:hypothetical protein